MRTSTFCTAMCGVLFASLASATGDISLAQFTPRIDNLPSTCKTVYSTKIDACVSSDFAVGATCSSACVAGLVKIGAAVKTGCAGVDVGETSIIGVFQNDLGTAALCPNNRQPGTTSSRASPSASSTLRTSLQTSTRTSTPLVSTTASPASSSGQPPAASSLSSSSSGIAVDTTATGASSIAFADPTAVPTTSLAPGSNSQLSNSDSGGGSPFDVVATGSAGRVRMTETALLSALAAAVLVAWV